MNEYNEINKFNNLAHEWWNMDGEFKTLHHINPVRLKFITNHVDLSGKKVIDVGCGGGILTESIAQYGVASITGIDLAPQSIEVAKLHLYESGLNIDYQCVDIKTIAHKSPQCYDVVICMEMLEHVNNPSVIIQNCNKLLKPGGYAFFSTLNRTLKSYALGVITAEYILKLLPKGTHDYTKFIKPSELRGMLVDSNLNLIDIKGLHYNPLNNTVSTNDNVDINYMVCCNKQTHHN